MVVKVLGVPAMSVTGGVRPFTVWGVAMSMQGERFDSCRKLALDSFVETKAGSKDMQSMVDTMLPPRGMPFMSQYSKVAAEEE